VDRRGLEFFAREARAGGRLAHPGIVAVHGTGEEEGLHWIAMELVDEDCDLRRSIDSLREEGELGVGYYRHVAEFTAELADALEAAHRAGVIHRDLKPGNVLVTREDRPKVSDFGLAKLVDERSISLAGELAGTYYYMSPEQLTAKRVGIDQRTDVFSLGVVLYEMLTLARPFEGDTNEQVTRKILWEDPVDPRQIRSRTPRDLAVICAKAMEKEPARRYQTMAELAADLRRHLAGEPILARPSGPLVRFAKWARRNSTKVVAAVALVAISGLTWLVLSWGYGQLHALRTLARGPETGDLGVLLESREELSAPFSLFAPDPLHPGDDPTRSEEGVARVLRALDETGLEDALRLATAFLERDGPKDHPHLKDFLLRAARGEVLTWREESGFSRNQLSEYALRLVARLFNERRAETDGETSLVSHFRRFLLDHLRQESSTIEKGQILTGLSGCGTIEDLRLLLEDQLAEAANTGDPELVRLVLACAHRILLRLWDDDSVRVNLPSDYFARISAGASRTLQSPGFAAGWGQDTINIWSWWSDLLVTMNSTDFHRGADGVPPLPEEVLREFNLWGPPAAAFGHEDVPRWLAGGGDIHDVHRAGNATAYWSARNRSYPAENDLADRVRLSHPSWTKDDLWVFDKAIQDGHRWFAQDLPELEPDKDTHLAEELLWESKGEPGSKDLETEEGTKPDCSSCLAEWDLTEEAVKISGGATKARTVGLSDYFGPSQESASHRLMVPGRTRFELGFDLRQGTSLNGMVLSIEHLIGHRRYLYRGGSVVIAISLDGELLVECHAVSSYGKPALVLPLGAYYLHPGPHRITIHFVEGNTTYWLRRVTVREVGS